MQEACHDQRRKFSEQKQGEACAPPPMRGTTLVRARPFWEHKTPASLVVLIYERDRWSQRRR
jgi:hypothetical protein